MIHIPEFYGLPGPLARKLTDAPCRHSVTPAYAELRPATNEVEQHNTPLNLRTVEMGEYRNLRGKRQTMFTNGSTNGSDGPARLHTRFEFKAVPQKRSNL